MKIKQFHILFYLQLFINLIKKNIELIGEGFAIIDKFLVNNQLLWKGEFSEEERKYINSRDWNI